MSEVPNKPGRGPALCPKCKKGKIIALFSGFADAEATVSTNGDLGPIEEMGTSHEWSIYSLTCNGDECGWEIGSDADDPEEMCEKFLKKLEKKAK